MRRRTWWNEVAYKPEAFVICPRCGYKHSRKGHTCQVSACGFFIPDLGLSYSFSTPKYFCNVQTTSNTTFIYKRHDQFKSLLSEELAHLENLLVPPNATEDDLEKIILLS